MVTITEIIEFIFDRLETEGYVFSDKSKGQIEHAIINLNALPDNVIDEINAFVSQSNPSLEEPEWLSIIDSYFDPKNSLLISTVDQFTQHRQFVSIVQLLLPLIFIDQITSLKGFSTEFLYSLELAFLTRLQVPRSKPEAERLYDHVLILPDKPKKRLFRKRDKIDPPYRAQMLFAVLIMAESEPDSALWSYQLECLQKAPAYLMNYPSIRDDSGSYRPAFWMAYDVTDHKFREVLTERASGEYRRCLDGAVKFESERDQAIDELAATDGTTAPLKELVSQEQYELVDLLNELDALLSQHHPDVYSGLQPGAHPEQIAKLNTILAPLKLPDDLTTLYLWHNGVADEGFLFGFPDFLPLEYVLQQYRESIDIMGEFGWCKAWLPISYESRVHRISPLSESQQIESPLYYYDIEGGEVELNHQSLKQFIRTIIEAYRTGLMAVDEYSGYRECNIDEFEKLRIKFSPDAYIYPGNEKPSYDPYDSKRWPEEWKKHFIREGS